MLRKIQKEKRRTLQSNGLTHKNKETESEGIERIEEDELEEL